MNNYLVEHHLTSFRLSTEALLEKIMPGVTDKYEFDISQ